MRMSARGVEWREMPILQYLENILRFRRPDGAPSQAPARPGSVEGLNDRGDDPERRTTGRGRTPDAVRKAEACPPAPDPASQVAADLGARVRATSRA